ncbi:MAG: M3 family oligoendopeptidase [Anaerolineae bacterium]
MFDTLPKDTATFMNWSWSQIEPYYDALATRELSAATVDTWLKEWTLLGELIGESYTRLYVATTVDTTDEAAVTRFHTYLGDIMEKVEPKEQILREKVIASGLNPPGFEIALRNMKTDVALFREANIPLNTEEQKLTNEYDRIVGAQTVQWEGQELTLMQLKPVFHTAERPTREQAWKLASERRLADRAELNKLWGQFLELRLKMTENVGFESYRDFRWQQFKRFDYSPQDCMTFHEAIEEVAVPAASRIYERQRRKLGVETLRPWDLDRDDVYPPSRPPLHPYKTIDELEGKAEGIFNKVDPYLAQHFSTMRRENLLDLDNRKGKAPGGYCITLGHSRRAFIFMNAVGIHDDVQTLFHEAGHAFHAFESVKLPYNQQRDAPIEMCEVASMSMELLAAPYLPFSEGGYYTPRDAARARIEHMEQNILFWPYMAVVDAFQHWVYSNPQQAADPVACDAQWGELWARFIPGVDWSGLEDARVTGWHRKAHIFEIPFYYVDYGLAQIGAIQVWRNALRDQAQAVSQYRDALSLGGTRPLPELFAAAGAKFAFDASMLGELVNLMETTMAELEQVQ